MPIYEYYCPDNDRIYQFYARTLAQGGTVPMCPDNPGHRMVRIQSAFSVVGREGDASHGSGTDSGGDVAGGAEDPRMDAAMDAMEGEFAGLDENDPKAMGRMMRRMSELTGERLDGEMEEVVRKLEEGADPESLEERLGDSGTGGNDGPGVPAPDAAPVPRPLRRARRGPTRDPKLYDYDA
jgi:hypothetical protein